MSAEILTSVMDDGRGIPGRSLVVGPDQFRIGDIVITRYYSKLVQIVSEWTINPRVGKTIRVKDLANEVETEMVPEDFRTDTQVFKYKSCSL